MKKIKKIKKIIFIILCVFFIGMDLYFNFQQEIKKENTTTNATNSYVISNIPEYSGKIYIELNNNIPLFSEEDFNIENDYYSNLENNRVRNGFYKNKLEKSK